MKTSDFRLFGRGLYSPVEASLLTKVPLRRINRWTRGYWFTHRGRRTWSEPVIGTAVERIGNAPVLSFADLMEVRFLSAFRDQNVSWRTIRLAVLRAREIFGTTHPFSSQPFTTDGRAILTEISDDAGDRHLLDLVKDQLVFQRVMVGWLRETMHYEGRPEPQWWSPLGWNRQVILHPSRSFGAPIVRHEGIRTRVLYGAFQAEGSAEAAAAWYRVTPAAVTDAVEFEVGLRQAA